MQKKAVHLKIRSKSHIEYGRGFQLNSTPPHGFSTLRLQFLFLKSKHKISPMSIFFFVLPVFSVSCKARIAITIHYYFTIYFSCFQVFLPKFLKIKSIFLFLSQFFYHFSVYCILLLHVFAAARGLTTAAATRQRATAKKTLP